MVPVTEAINRDPDLEWLDLVKPTGLVLSPTVIKERGLVPERQTGADSAAFAACLGGEDEPALAEPWPFVRGDPWVECALRRRCAGRVRAAGRSRFRGPGA